MLAAVRALGFTRQPSNVHDATIVGVAMLASDASNVQQIVSDLYFEATPVLC